MSKKQGRFLILGIIISAIILIVCIHNKWLIAQSIVATMFLVSLVIGLFVPTQPVKNPWDEMKIVKVDTMNSVPVAYLEIYVKQKDKPNEPVYKVYVPISKIIDIIDRKAVHEIAMKTNPIHE